MATIRTRIRAEEKRLRLAMEDCPDERMKAVDGLIQRAAWMRIQLDDLEADIQENGLTEPFTQSASAPPYERKRPAVDIYINMAKSYTSIIKQLSDQLPKGTEIAVDDGFESFVINR